MSCSSVENSPNRTSTHGQLILFSLYPEILINTITGVYGFSDEIPRPYQSRSQIYLVDSEAQFVPTDIMAIQGPSEVSQLTYEKWQYTLNAVPDADKTLLATPEEPSLLTDLFSFQDYASEIVDSFFPQQLTSRNETISNDSFAAPSQSKSTAANQNLISIDLGNQPTRSKERTLIGEPPAVTIINHPYRPGRQLISSVGQTPHSFNSSSSYQPHQLQTEVERYVGQWLQGPDTSSRFEAGYIESTRQYPPNFHQRSRPMSSDGKYIYRNCHISLKRKRENRDTEVLDSDFSQPPSTAHKVTTVTGRTRTRNPKTKFANSRSRNIELFDPSIYYRPLQEEEIPSPWENFTRQHQFAYDEYGQLSEPMYTAAEINAFVYENPGNFLSPDRQNWNPKRGTFVLYIQTSPSDSKLRYSPEDGSSSKCRFDCCPVRKKTISKGQYRVALDERGRDPNALDPYNVAAYVHLFCLERFLDFPRICRDLNVMSDVRRLREPRNLMSICRDHPENEAVVRKFLEEAGEKASGGEWDYTETLCSILTEIHLDLEPSHHFAVREAAGGNHIGFHKNNLEVMVERAGEIQRRKAEERKAKKTSKLFLQKCMQ